MEPPPANPTSRRCHPPLGGQDCALGKVQHAVPQVRSASIALQLLHWDRSLWIRSAHLAQTLNNLSQLDNTSPRRKKPAAPAAQAERMVCPDSPACGFDKPPSNTRDRGPTPVRDQRSSDAELLRLRQARCAHDMDRNCSGVTRQYGVLPRLRLRTHLRATGAMSNRSLYTMVCTDQPWSRAVMKFRIPSTKMHPDASRVRLSAINERISEKVGPVSSDRRSFVSSAAILLWPGRPAQISRNDVSIQHCSVVTSVCENHSHNASSKVRRRGHSSRTQERLACRSSTLHFSVVA
jgi:hypothetical protein